MPGMSRQKRTIRKTSHLQGLRVSDRTRTGDHLDHNSVDPLGLSWSAVVARVMQVSRQAIYRTPKEVRKT